MTDNNDTHSVTTASAWRKPREGVELRVPSGNVCLVRPTTGLDSFVRSGRIPNSLMPFVEKAMAKGKPPTTADMEMTPELLSDLMNLMDQVTIDMVISPVVKRIPQDEKGEDLPLSQRPEGDFLWVDDIDFEDKTFIFNYAVGGTRDVKKFRRELGEYVGAVPGSEDLDLPPKPTVAH